jgi:DNA mismatch repair protein MutL
MGQIRVLDRNMINMIAAGEVIERPASVVKELVENCIDAGATKIDVTVEDGGRKLISITDNGCGMDADDLATAFESHTTSKIKTDSDLHNISTLGFRGEALASIASVAQVKTVSRTRNSDSANCIEIDCGTKTNISPCSGDYGTRIEVRDIFYKLPARRKFLRTANTEMGHITEQFIRIALANARSDETEGLDLTLIHNGREIYRLPADQSLLQRIAELFPALPIESSDDFILAESCEKGLNITAVLGKPEISRTSNKFQYVFLNGRFIRDKFISHAVKEAYRGLLESDRFPVVFLYIKMPYADYDVNVHPTKIEVRFYNSNLVHSQILGVIREKLLGTDLSVHAKLPSEKSWNLPTTRPGQDPKIADAMAEFLRKHRPVQTQQRFGFRSSTAVLTPRQISEKQATFERKFIQIHDSFIVEQTDDGFVIIDQHALHESLIYEDLHKRIQNSRLQSQKLLMPESFEVTVSERDTLERHAGLFEKLGIELVPFGPKSVAIQSFPSLLSDASPLEFVRDIIDLLDRKDTDFDHERLLDEVLNMVACKAAIKAGRKLTDVEIEQLLADKQTAESSSRCPHGRPTTIKFSISELEKQFKRT